MRDCAVLASSSLPHFRVGIVQFVVCFRSHTGLDEMCSPLLVIREKET
jgi:hypothetical protein